MTVLSSSVIGSLDDVSLVRICGSNKMVEGESATDDDGNNNNNITEDEADANIISKWVQQASELLNFQWPRGGTAEKYKEKIINEGQQQSQLMMSNRHQLDDVNSSFYYYYGLPASYLLIHENDCIGHGRLTECFESAGGNAAAVTFIVINSTRQSHGFGRKLMTLLELEAERLGYHYIYLWTKTAIGFYEKLGYSQCQRVSLKRACLKKLVSHQVESLENLLMKRRSKILIDSISMDNNKAANKVGKKDNATAVGSKKKETILLPPDDDGNDDAPDVWLKKRLVEQVGSIHVPMDERIAELESYIEEKDGSSASINRWYYYHRIVSIPWQAQIGPSCGLAALRMVREYLMMASAKNESGEDGEQEQLPSLLQEAQERGFTQDGEIFNVNDLKEMADTVCGIDSEILSVPSLTPRQVNTILAKGGVFILPYDSNPGNRLPAKWSGQKAHYGIIVGVAVEITDSNTTTEANDEDQRKGDLHPITPENEHLLDGADASNVSLMIQHGLSAKLCIAPWQSFVESNAQLIGFDEDKFGTVQLDLKDRILVCRGMQS